MIHILTKEALAAEMPTAKNKPGFRLMEHLRFVEQIQDGRWWSSCSPPTLIYGRPLAHASGERGK